MGDLPYYSGIFARILTAAGEALVMVWILYFLPDELRVMITDFRIWREFRRLKKTAKVTDFQTWRRLRKQTWIEGELEEVEQWPE